MRKYVILFFIFCGYQHSFSQIEKQRADFQNFRDSINTKLTEKAAVQDLDGIIELLDYSLQKYEKLDIKLQKELNLAGSLNYNIARIYSFKNDEKNTLKYLKKAVKSKFTKYSWWQNQIQFPEKENKDINKEIIKLCKIKARNHPDTVFVPWHLTDVIVCQKKSEVFEKLEIDFSVLTDIPDYLNFYIAPLNGTIIIESFMVAFKLTLTGKT